MASQRAGATTPASALSEVRFPADQGIAGAVLAGGEAILVDDAQNDPRFYAGVDHKTGVTTRTLLAAPLRSARGAVGVIEVVNEQPGSPLRLPRGRSAETVLMNGIAHPIRPNETD